MRWYHVFLAVLLVISGSINTICAKWMFLQTSVNSDGEDTEFIHPFLDTEAMFFGEFLCIIVYKILFCFYSHKEEGLEQQKKLTQGNTDFNHFILMIPAVCDMAASSINHVGLNLTYASSYQMFRGGVIIFTAILSIIFLDRRLGCIEWLGLFLIIFGLALVGISDFVYQVKKENQSIYNIVIGDLLIFFAQILTATQVVFEQKYTVKLDIAPLYAVGLEGIYGFCILGLFLIPAYFIYVGEPFAYNPRGVIEDVIDAFIQMKNNIILIIALIILTCSIGFFNFAGVSIAKEISALTRKVLDNIRTVVIWIVSLMFLGQKFQWLQLLGFIILVYGIFLYYKMTIIGEIIDYFKTRGETTEE